MAKNTTPAIKVIDIDENYVIVARADFDALVARAYPPAPVAELVTAKPNSFYATVIGGRVPCDYGHAECGRFAPNGVGKAQHSTCAEGRAAMAAARRK